MASLIPPRPRKNPKLPSPAKLSIPARSPTPGTTDVSDDEGRPTNSSSISLSIPSHNNSSSALTDDLRNYMVRVHISDHPSSHPSSRPPSTVDLQADLNFHAGAARSDAGAGGAGEETKKSVLEGDDVPEDFFVEPDDLEIIGRLGEGASGAVVKARHKPTGLVMAKKTMQVFANPTDHKQLLRELSFNRECRSPYITRFYGAFLEDEDTSVAICMEYCEAGSLEAIYKRVKALGGRTGEKVLGKVSEAVLKGIVYLRSRKIIHRDIKPSNILVTRAGQIKLCDFGVSGELMNSFAGTFTGTSNYMAPERIRGDQYNASSDVWSLGLTILEVASNRFPFPPEGEPPLGPIELLTYVMDMKVPELQDDERIKWSSKLKNFIENCLERDPKRRPSPVKMCSHPFIKASEARHPPPDMAKFVAEVWGWPYTPSTAANAPSRQGNAVNAGPHPISVSAGSAAGS